MKKKGLIFLTTLATATLFSGCGIKQTATTTTVEAGQELSLKATDFFNIKEEKAGEIAFDTSKVDVNTVGEYDVTASYKKDSYTIKVTVEDTTAPSVELAQRFFITNDITAVDPMAIVDGIYDSSEYTVKFIRFEKSGSLDVMTDKVLGDLVNNIPIPCDQKALAELGTEEIPTEEGIYRSVLAVTDAYGNTQLEEVAVILDTTGALIEEVEDKVIEVDAADLDTTPEVNPADYTITDNVDGSIPAEDVVCELEVRDAEKHEYLVHVSYTDRAGNESKAEFLITLKEKEKVVASNETSGNGGTSSDGGNNSNGGGNSDAGNNGGSTDNGGAQVVTPEPTPTPEPESEIDPTTQAMINAGYYVVVPYASGDGYCVMVHDGEYDYGAQLLRDYLASMGYEANNISGGYINSEANRYGCYAENIVPLVTPDDSEFWN